MVAYRSESIRANHHLLGVDIQWVAKLVGTVIRF